jgi:hypothetical protein
MAFLIEAPHPAVVTSHYLPNPLSGDSVNSVGSVEFKRSMNGKKYTYVKSRDKRKRLLWTFRLTHAKALELQAYFEAYISYKAKITDHMGKVYVGDFITNPFEFEAVGRSAPTAGNTLHTIQLEFQGFEQDS